MRFAFAIRLLCFAAWAVVILEAVPAQIPPDLSKQPLSADQIAVYQDFLRAYDANVMHHQSQRDDAGAKWHVASYTIQFGSSEFTAVSKSVAWGCLKDVGPVVGEESIHLIPKSVLSDDMELVDPVTQKAKDRLRTVEKPDPGLKADPAGYLILSEIVFTPDHHLAVFRYAYLCGDLCGTGGVMVYEREQGQWAESKHRHCGNVVY